MSKKWYVLRVVSGKEKKTKEIIEKEIDRNEQMKQLIENVVLPVEKVFQIRNGKKYAKERNFYPGYLLIETEMNGDVQHVIEHLPNVLSFLKDNDTPQPLKPIEVNRILKKIDDLVGITEFESPFIVGESIVITDGPFTSFNATITSIDENKKTVKASVRIFGRETPIDLSFLQIDKV